MTDDWQVIDKGLGKAVKDEMALLLEEHTRHQADSELATQASDRYKTNLLRVAIYVFRIFSQYCFIYSM